MLVGLNNWVTAVLLAGGGGAAVAFGIFRTLGSKWLEDKFAARLEIQRHENAKETERLKLAMSRQLDRATKLSQREFDALPQIWEAVVDAVEATRISYVRFTQRPDLTRMSHEDLEAYLVRSGIPEHHRKEILTADESDRNQLLGRSEQIQCVSDAWTKVSEARRRVRALAIFLPEDLRTGFTEIVDLTRRALVDAEMRIDEHLKRSELPDAERLRKEGDDLLNELETKVRGRLRGAGEAET